MEKKLISFDLKADFGCLKKPDVNQGLLLSFNMLHKPALLGILGAIVGLPGYDTKGQLPDYYQVFKTLPVGIEPLNHDKGNFSKVNIAYTNGVGYANKDGTLIVTEQTLLSPSYRVYLLLDFTNPWHDHLYNRLKANEAVFLPYLGKNECAAWFGDDATEGYALREYTFTDFIPDAPFKIDSIFIKKYPLVDSKKEAKLSFFTSTASYSSSFVYFERLPLRFDETLLQYELADFSFSDWYYKPDSVFDSLLAVSATQALETKIIQLF